MDLVIHSIADRPNLTHLLNDFPGAWPAFMYHDPTSRLFYQEESASYARFCLVAIDRDRPDRAVAKAGAVPFTWDWHPPAHPDPHPPGVPDGLPIGGYDDVIQLATLDRLAGRRGTMLAPVEIAVQVDYRGRGLSGIMLDALREHATRLGYRDLVAPVRPSAKHTVPHEPMERYLARVRDDGLPTDPWLRVHARAGGQIICVAPRSMTIAGSLAEWRAWTGLPFDVTGPVVVPHALVPVHCDVDAGHAVYVEPNVWMHHKL